MTVQQPCFCGGSPPRASLENCCGPALNAEAWPVTAEALMRSRYSAFVSGNTDHLFRTWHPRFRPVRIELDPATQWLGLQIIEVVEGSESDSTGIVEFVAAFREDGVEENIHERSRFSKRAGRWMYEDGEHS